LDCVASEFIKLARFEPEFEKSVEFTTKARALGLGALGYHTLLQKRRLPFESLEAHMLNIRLFREIKSKAVKASKHLATWLGEPEWCVGTGMRNSHLLAIAPNTSSALICGGVSQGIEPVVSNLFVQPTSTGDINRISPEFLALAKSYGKFDEDLIADLVKTQGSVQHLDWLTDHEKAVFKTAYEIDQFVILRKASARQPEICQGQSLNLFVPDTATEQYLSDLAQTAALDENILGLYYLRSAAGVQASTGECVACEG
jgi:ribonucleoside-diphosphate reductase alpha chain